MIDPSERKMEIESKLEKELNNLNLLKERAQKSSHLTKGMVGILNSFEHRLARLEETILPVYNETGNLQRRQENIERTLTALDHVIGFYGVSQEVDRVVRAGPTPTPAGLDSYLKAMAKLRAALEYFEKNNPQSVELENVSTLYSSGGDALNREFKDVLFKHSKPVAPIMLLDLVANDDDTVSGEDAPASLTHFPDSVSQELVTIAEWLMDNNRDEYMNVYARVRATVLLKSLQQLKDHQKTASGGSMQNVSGASGGSPMPRTKFRHETPSRRASRRLQRVFKKEANKMLLKASQTLELSTGLTLGPRRPQHMEDVVDEQEMENYLECVMALQRLMSSERHLMQGVVPAQHRHQIFQIVIKDAMDMVVQDGDNIASRAKRCISRHDFAAVLVVFPILKHLQLMKPEFDRTVEGCDVNVKSKFSSILNTLHSTGSKALEDFIESVRSDPSTQLPKDGTVHELTSNVLVFLEQLLDYVDTIAEVLGQDPAYNKHPALAPDNRSNALLGIYIKKVLSQLNLTLLTKSDLYGDVFLRAVFRLNNNNYVLKAVQRSGLLDLVRLCEPDCENNYHAMILDHKRGYSASWSKVLSNIWTQEDTGPVALVHLGKLRDKDRNTIKERFANFNKEMEEIGRVQRGYSIPDVELRESLKRDNKEYVLPKYSAFYNKYACVQFTKNVDKYVKYTPAQVSALIDRFFDVAA